MKKRVDKKLRDLLVEHYAHHLTDYQNKDILIKLSKEHNQSYEDTTVDAYKKYKDVLNNLSKLGLEYLITACAYVENSDPRDKLITLMNFCNKLQIKIE